MAQAYTEDCQECDYYGKHTKQQKKRGARPKHPKEPKNISNKIIISKYQEAKEATASAFKRKKIRKTNKERRYRNLKLFRAGKNGKFLTLFQEIKIAEKKYKKLYDSLMIKENNSELLKRINYGRISSLKSIIGSYKKGKYIRTTKSHKLPKMSQKDDWYIYINSLDGALLFSKNLPRRLAPFIPFSIFC